MSIRITARDSGGLLGSLALCLAVAALNGVVTRGGLDPWYRALRQPAFKPPDWLFAPVWTTLFVLMALALWRVWRLPASAGRRRALQLFGVQLALNLLWSCLFFGLRSPGLALAEIGLLWAAILATVRAFRRLEWVAGALLLPYLAWVSFAALLNAAIVRLN